jgi:hypothetical protein
MSARFPLSVPKWRRPRYRRFETGAHGVRRATLEVIARAFKEAGVEFIDEDGEARDCGYESSTQRRVRQQATESLRGHRVHRRERWGAATKAAAEENLGLLVDEEVRISASCSCDILIGHIARSLFAEYCRRGRLPYIDGRKV